MLTTDDVRIVYLRLMRREPTSAELTYATENLSSVDELEKYIRTTDVYKAVRLTEAEYLFDRSTDTITTKTLKADDYEGVLMSNGVVGFVTTHMFNNCARFYIKHNKKDSECPDPTTIELRRPGGETQLRVSNHQQHLKMGDCCFTDTFECSDDVSGATIQAQVDKFPLHTVKSCVVQRVRLESDLAITLHLVHSLKRALAFNQYVIALNESVNGDLYEVLTEDVALTTLTHSSTPLTHKSPKRLPNGSFEDYFEFVLAPNDPVHVYIITICNPLESRNTNKNILRNLFYNSSSGEEIVSNHLDVWRNNYWTTTLDILLKQEAEEVDIQNTVDTIGTIRRAIFTMYSDISNTSVDTLLFGIPVLILLKPNIAQDVIEILIERLDPANMFQQQDRHTTTAHYFQKVANETYFIYSTAILCVHIWNFFRATVNRNWLINVGYPAMQRCCNFLVTQEKTKNTVVDYLVSSAFHYMHQTMYELNYVQPDLYPKHAVALDYMNDFADVVVTGTTIHMRIEESNSLEHFAFYDQNNTYLGYKFGGTSGYKLKLQEDTVYTFKFEFALKDYPVQFIKKQMVANTHLIIIEGDEDFEPYHDISSDGTLRINSDEIISYGLDALNHNYNTFRKRFNVTYGANAFASHTIHNVLKPYLGFANGDPVGMVEPYVLFNSYYNPLFFRGKSPLNVAHKTEYVNIIEDNVSYYESVSSRDSHFNVLFEAAIHNTVSQYKTGYSKRRAKNIQCYHKLTQTLKSTALKRHWLYDDAISPQLLFALLTSFFELSITGEIREDRLMVIDYGVSLMTKHYLPEPWAGMVLYNAGIANKTHFISNTLLLDSPFKRFADGLRIVSSLVPSSQTVRIELDFSRVFPHGVPDDLDYYVHLQAPDDDTDYSDPAARATLLTRTPLLHKTPLITYSYTNAVTETTASATPLVVDAALNGARTVHFVYNRAQNDATFDLITRTVFTPSKYTSAEEYPTVEVTVSYIRNNRITVSLGYNSLFEKELQPFTTIEAVLQYNPSYVHASTLKYNYQNGHIASATYTNDLSRGEVTLVVTTDVSVVSPYFYMGTFVFELVEESMVSLSGVALNELVRGVAVSTNRAFVHVNPEIHPPAVTVPTIPDAFVAAPVVLSVFYSENNAWYPDVKTLSYCSGIGALAERTHLLQPTEDGASVVDVVAGGTHVIFVYNNRLQPRAPPTFNAYGNNSHRQTLVASSEASVSAVTACDALNGLPALTGTETTAVYTTSQSTLVLHAGRAYGVGHNESYNLGTGANVNITTLTDCALINALVQDLGSNITTIAMNESGTLLVLGQNKLYAIGEHPAFGDSPYTAPTSLDSINAFLAAEGYLVKRVDTGKDHFKILLSKATGADEWWGFGRNTHHSMGLDAHVDASTTITGRLCRLHALERFVHGTKYDPTYTGPRARGRGTYHLVHSRGVPASATVMVDIGENRVYFIGTFDPTAEAPVAHAEWEEVLPDDQVSVAAARFFAMYDSGFLMGAPVEPIRPAHELAFENVAVYGGTIENTGLTVNDVPYETTGVGKLLRDPSGFKYLEMQNGQLRLPPYTTSPSAISHTFYFVTKAKDADGSIPQMTTSDNKFDIRISPSETGFYPIKWPNTTSWQITAGFAPKDSYVITVLKAKYKSPYVYDARVQLIAKPDDEYVYAGQSSELANLPTFDCDLGTEILLGNNDDQTNGFKFYEYGVIDQYLDDAAFDALAHSLIVKYYGEAPDLSEMTHISDISNIGDGDAGSNESINLEEAPRGDYTYVFEINRLPHSGTLILSYIKANGVSLDSWSDFMSITALLPPNDPNKNDINVITQESASAAAWINDVVKQGDEIFRLITTRRVLQFEIGPHRPLYAPGWNIYENGRLVLSEPDNRGNASEPSNDTGLWHYTYFPFTGPIYKYTFEISVQNASTIHFLGRTLKVNGNFIETWDKFIGVSGEPPDRTGSMVDLYKTDLDGPSWFLRPVGTKMLDVYTSERATTIELAYYRQRYVPGWNIYENDVLILSETTNGGTSESPASHDVWTTYTFIGETELDPEAFSFESSTEQGRTKMLPFTSANHHYYKYGPIGQQPYWNTAWNIMGNLENTFTYYTQLDGYGGQVPSNNLQFTFTKPTFVHFGLFESNWSDENKNQLTKFIGEWFGSNIIALQEDTSHSKGRWNIYSNRGTGNLNWVYGLVQPGTYAYDLYKPEHSLIINSLICVGKSTEFIVQSDTPPSATVTTDGQDAPSMIDLVDGMSDVRFNSGTGEDIWLLESNQTRTFDTSVDKSVLSLVKTLLQLKEWNGSSSDSNHNQFSITVADHPCEILVGTPFDNETRFNQAKDIVKLFFGVTDADLTLYTEYGYFLHNTNVIGPMFWYGCVVQPGTYNSPSGQGFTENWNWIAMAVSANTPSSSMNSLLYYDMDDYDPLSLVVPNLGTHLGATLVAHGPTFDSASKSLVFDGTNDYMRVNHVGNTTGAWEHTVAFWVYISDHSTHRQKLFHIGPTSDTYGAVSFNLIPQGDGSCQWHYDLWGTRVKGLSSASALKNSLNRFNHVVVTYDGSTQKVYHDGAQITDDLTYEGGSPLNMVNANVAMEIGRDIRSSQYLSQGKIRQFQVFHKALSAEEINTLLPVLNTTTFEMGAPGEEDEAGGGDGGAVGPFYYTFHIMGSFAFQAALVEIELIDSAGGVIAITQDHISDTYRGRGFLSDLSDPTPLFDGVTTGTPMEYYHNFFSGLSPQEGFKIFTLETAVVVSQIHVHYNNWGNKPADTSSSWTMRVDIRGESATISDVGDFITTSARHPAVIIPPPPAAGVPADPRASLFWRISFAAQSSGNRWLGANNAYANYSDSHGQYIGGHPKSMRIRTETSDISTLTTVPDSIARSEIAKVEINRGGNAAFKGGTTHFTHDSIFYDVLGDTYLYLKSGLYVIGDNYMYNRVSIIDIEFTSPQAINEFIYSGLTIRAALPYMIKIEYSENGVDYTTDVEYIRNSTNSAYPRLNRFDTSQTDTPHMIMQRVRGNWADSVSKKLD